MLIKITKADTSHNIATMKHILDMLCAGYIGDYTKHITEDGIKIIFNSRTRDIFYEVTDRNKFLLFVIRNAIEYEEV